MNRLAVFLALAMAHAIPATAMETSEPVPGITVTRGPGTSPEPDWRAAQRDAFILGTTNEPREIRVHIRTEPNISAW